MCVFGVCAPAWRGGVFVCDRTEDIHVILKVTVRISGRHISPYVCKPAAPSERESEVINIWQEYSHHTLNPVFDVVPLP